MNALDMFNVITGVFSLYALVLSACRWVSPIRRLHALDEAIHRLEELLESTREEMLFDHRNLDIVRDAQERMFSWVFLSVQAMTSLIFTLLGHFAALRISARVFATRAPCSISSARSCLVYRSRSLMSTEESRHCTRH
jgi:hypothetical protein